MLSPRVILSLKALQFVMLGDKVFIEHNVRRLPRLFQSALLRYRYEGLSPSGVSVNGVRNDKV